MLLIKYIFVVSHVDVELMLYDENLGKNLFSVMSFGVVFLYVANCCRCSCAESECRKVFNIVRVYSAPANAKNRRRNQTLFYYECVYLCLKFKKYE